VRSLGADRFDAIVCFEGIEHVPEPDALLDELGRLRGRGARLLLSLPNSRGFEEDNEFHVTDFGYESMQAAAERIGGAAIVEQHLAEASVLRRAGDSGEIELRGRLRTPGEDEAAWANHWLLLAGVDDAALASASARLSAAAALNQNGYMKLLERANADLVRHNARLSRTWLGLHDAAAAAMVRRLQEAEARAEFAESEAERWEDIADNNDWARQERENELKGLEARLAGPRYAAMDAVYYRLTAFKTGKRLVDGIGSLARRAKR
jgi:SAM-dependent methyltransferase